MPDPSIVDCAAAALLKPRYARAEGKPLLTKRTAVSCPQGSNPVLEFVIRDEEGRPINLAGCGFVDSSSSSAGTDDGSVKLRMNEALARGTEGLVETDAVVMDAESGTVRARIPKTATALAGAMIAEWGVFSKTGDLMFSNEMYILVESSLFAAASQTGGLPKIAEVRTYMRDHKDGNFLLKDYEWDLAEIIEAATAAVTTWNSTAPRINRRYNTANFYDPNMLIDGIMAELYMMAARLYARDHLPYSAGGISLDDKNKSQEYMAIGQQLQQSYVTLVKMDKARMNAAQWNGTNSSPYGRR